jgi:BRCT domain type II-containing protein
LLEYYEKLCNMFEGNTVDGSTSWMPSSTRSRKANVVISDEEGDGQEEDLTPVSQVNKRASSTSTTASTPTKKSKSPAVRSMNAGIAAHCEIAKAKL